MSLSIQQRDNGSIFHEISLGASVKNDDGEIAFSEAGVESDSQVIQMRLPKSYERNKEAFEKHVAANSDAKSPITRKSSSQFLLQSESFLKSHQYLSQNTPSIQSQFRSNLSSLRLPKRDEVAREQVLAKLNLGRHCSTNSSKSLVAIRAEYQKEYVKIKSPFFRAAETAMRVQESQSEDSDYDSSYKEEDSKSRSESLVSCENTSKFTNTQKPTSKASSVNIVFMQSPDQNSDSFNLFDLKESTRKNDEQDILHLETSSSTYNSIFQKIINAHESLKKKSDLEDMKQLQVEQEMNQMLRQLKTRWEKLDKNMKLQHQNSKVGDSETGFETKMLKKRARTLRTQDKKSRYTMKTSRKKRKITECPHENSLHYAKGMCNFCYHTRGRNGNATKCEHTDRNSYAKGMCQSCYFKLYNQTKRM